MKLCSNIKVNTRQKVLESISSFYCHNCFVRCRLATIPNHILVVYIYILKKKHVFLSVRPSTFYICCYFSKNNNFTQKIIIELGWKNSKKDNWKEKIAKEYFN